MCSNIFSTERIKKKKRVSILSFVFLCLFLQQNMHLELLTFHAFLSYPTPTIHLVFFVTLPSPSLISPTQPYILCYSSLSLSHLVSLVAFTGAAHIFLSLSVSGGIQNISLVHCLSDSHSSHANMSVLYYT